MSAEAELLKKAKSTAARYCAMGERSPRQVKDKLLKNRLTNSQAEEVISALRNEGFLDEVRFACAFCNDKLKFNTWGKNRLRLELSSHQVKSDVIEDALSNIDDVLYKEVLLQVLEKKLRLIPENDPFLAKKKKLTDFAVRKGFESSLVFSLADRLLSPLRQ